MAINNEPTIKPITVTGIFTKYIAKTLPLAFDESMSYYECLCAMLEYLNETIVPDINNANEGLGELQEFYEELQEYVNTYFDNLDVQNEINTKLDKMASDGTLYNIINNQLFTDMNNQILQNAVNIGTLNEEMDGTIKITDNNVITNSMLSQEVREALTGGSTAVVGENSVGTENIQNKAVTIYKVDDLIQTNFTKEYEPVELSNFISGNYCFNDSGTLDIRTNANMSYCTANLTNGEIYQFIGANWYAVNGIMIVDSTDDNKIVASSSISNSSLSFTPAKILFQANKNGLIAYISVYTGAVSVSTPREVSQVMNLTKLSDISQNKKDSQLNLIKTLEGLGLANHKSTIFDFPNITGNQYATTKIYKLSKGTKYRVTGANSYENAGLVITNEAGDPSYISSNSNHTTQDNFEYEFTASDDGYALCMDMTFGVFDYVTNIYIIEEQNKYSTIKWCLIGDSLTDANVNQSVKKYYSYVQDDLGINIQNLGQSGCGYKRKYNGGNNFVEQTALIDNDADIITIFGSWNDGNEFSDLGHDTDTTTDTVLGSVYVAINNIITNRPHARLGIILPTPWISVNPQNITTNYQKYIDGIKTIAANNSVPVLDLFTGSNLYPWNESFKSSFFVSGDGVHPNTDGNKQFANKIEEFIKSL